MTRWSCKRPVFIINTQLCCSSRPSSFNLVGLYFLQSLKFIIEMSSAVPVSSGSSWSLSESEFLSAMASFSTTERSFVHSFLFIHQLFPDILSEAVGSLHSESASYKSAVSTSRSVCSLSSSSGFSEASTKVVPGDVYNNLESQLGKAKFKSIGKVTLKRIYFQEVGLSFLEGADKWVKEALGQKPGDEEHKKKVRYLLNHASLVLEIHCPGAHVQIPNPLYIRAEKVGAPPNVAGIVVTPDMKFCKDDTGITVRCVECNVPFDHLKEVEDILEQFEPKDYSLAFSNCRDYAEATYKALLQKCVARCAGGNHEKQYLQKEADDIEIYLGKMMFGDVEEALHKMRQAPSKALDFISKHLLQGVVPLLPTA